MKRWEYEQKLNEKILDLKERVHVLEILEDSHIREETDFKERQLAALSEAAIEELYWRVGNFRSLDAVKKALADPTLLKSHIEKLVKQISPFLVMEDWEAREFIRGELRGKWLKDHAEDDE